MIQGDIVKIKVICVVCVFNDAEQKLCPLISVSVSQFIYRIRDENIRLSVCLKKEHFPILIIVAWEVSVMTRRVRQISTLVTCSTLFEEFLYVWLMTVVYPSWLLTDRNLHITSEHESRLYLCWDQESSMTRTSSKARDIRDKTSVSDLLAFAPRSLSLRIPKEMRRERPRPRVMQSNLLKSKSAAKVKTLADVAVTSVLTSGDFVTSSPSCTKKSWSDVSTSIVMGLPPGLALPAFAGGIHPFGLPLVSGDAPPLEVGATPQPLAPAFVPSSTPRNDDLCWFHGPVSSTRLTMQMNSLSFWGTITSMRPVLHALLVWQGGGLATPLIGSWKWKCNMWVAVIPCLVNFLLRCYLPRIPVGVTYVRTYRRCVALGISARIVTWFTVTL